MSRRTSLRGVSFFNRLPVSTHHRVRVALKMQNLSAIPQCEEGEMTRVTDQTMPVIMRTPDGLLDALVRACAGLTWIRSLVHSIA